MDEIELPKYNYWKKLFSKKQKREKMGIKGSVFALGVLLVSSTVNAATITTAIGQGADVYVRSGSSANDNFNSDARLIFKDAGGSPSDFSRKSYLKFDLSSTASGGSVPEFADASLEITVNGFGETWPNPNIDHVVSIYGLNDFAVGNDWDENSITWNNAPANDPNSGADFLADMNYLGDLIIPTTINLGDTLSFSNVGLIGFLNSDTDGKVTFAIVDAITAVSGVTFVTKEDGTFAAPTLQLTAVPIPAPFLLLGTALAGLGWFRRKTS